MKKSITFFSKSILLLLLFGFETGVSLTQAQQKPIAQIGGSTTATYEGNLVAKEGAWCWFADPRALHYQNSGGTINSSYIGYIDVHGNIKATQHNFLTGKNNEVLIRSYFQPDDHNNPSFLVLPDERIMIFYSRHTDEACFYYRISKKPGDITSLGAEMKILTANNTTYPSPFILSDDPTHFYLCWRGINWHPTIAKLNIPDAQDNTSIVWGPYQMVQSTAARPYCKYESNGKDKIYLTYTLGHPDNENPNWVYFNYVDVNTLQLKDIKGTTLSTIANGVFNVSATAAYSTAYPYTVVDSPSLRDWVWQTTLDKDGLPVIALVQISADKLTHNYYYAKWTGSEWRKTFLANGGGKFHQTAGLELCYSGGMAIDDSNPNIVYCSVPTTGTSGSVYEIIKYTIAADGTVASTEALTTNSVQNNVRPFMLKNSANSPLRLIWMHGNYYDWIVSSSQPQGYPTAVHSDYALPVDNIDLTNGLVVNADFTSATITGTARTSGGVLVSGKDTYATLTASASPAFSVSLTPYIYEGAYNGTILRMGNLTYKLNGSTTKPSLEINTQTFASTNLLGTSDVWQTQARGTGGVWWEPTKLKYFNLTLTYENGVLNVFRNGLIDQVIEVPGLTLSDVTLGGFVGWVEDCRIYNRALTQGEVKKLTDISLAYTFSTSLVSEVELDALTIPQNAYTDIVLPATTSAGNAITWTSDNVSVITNAGLVTLPATPTPVNLTATANGKTKVFAVTVSPRNIANNKVFVYKFAPADVFTADGVKYVQDQSGKGNNATIYGTAAVNGTLDLTANTAAAFTTNGYAMAPNGVLNNLRSCTFLARLKPASLTGQPRIFDFGSASTNSILLRASALTAGYKYNNGSTVLINSSTQLTAGTEAKVAMTFDAKTKTTKIYLNGTEVASATTITYEPYQLTAIGANKRNYIGRTQWWDTSSAANNVDFNGTIDDFCLYDIALTSAEIAQIQTDLSTDVKSPVTDKLFSIYPNPASPNASVQINSSLSVKELQNLRVELLNSLGQPLKSVQPVAMPCQLDVPQSGMYLLRFVVGNGNAYVKKLVINN